MADINSDKDWSPMDLFDLQHSIESGRSLEEVAEFLCRDVQEVQAKMRELGFANRVRATSPGLP